MNGMPIPLGWKRIPKVTCSKKLKCYCYQPPKDSRDYQILDDDSFEDNYQILDDDLEESYEQ